MVISHAEIEVTGFSKESTDCLIGGIKIRNRALELEIGYLRPESAPHRSEALLQNGHRVSVSFYCGLLGKH